MEEDVCPLFVEGLNKLVEAHGIPNTFRVGEVFPVSPRLCAAVGHLLEDKLEAVNQRAKAHGWCISEVSRRYGIAVIACAG